MTPAAEDSRPLRQFRVTITEDRDGNVTHALLSWRSFPCAATKWDGQKWYTFAPHESSVITSVDALRDALAAIAAGDWYESRYPR